MYFDFDEYRPDISPMGRAISWREGILLSIIFHLGMVILLIAMPKLFPFDAAAARARALALEEQQRARQPERFVFVQPRIDMRALRPPERADASDQDRAARAPERAKQPTNRMPYSRGNSINPVEEAAERAAAGRGPAPEPSPPQEAKNQPAPPEQPKLPDAQASLQLPNRKPAEQGTIARATPSGALGDALRNLDRYVQQEQFDNPQGGGGSPDPNIQFDTKGVEFGPWIRRFVAQVRRNWEPLIPYAAMSSSLKGHVVVTFNIHKDGAISELAVVVPCPVDGFNHAAYGAMAASNPTYPLPAEYPDSKAFFTVTFFYNEAPPR